MFRILLALWTVLAGCERSGGARGGAAGPLLVDATSSLGLEAAPQAWPDGRYRLPELSAGGVALFDFDGDGDIDIFQACAPPPDRPDTPAPDRLFRQEPNGSFQEVPGAAGLADPGYGNGVALGDIDGDGDKDVFIANLGRDSLYENRGGGSFAEISGAAGILDDGWSTSAAFLDFDRDGDLDLFVARYLIDDPSIECRTSRSAPRDYCGPSRYRGVRDLLFRNRGDGTFEEVGLEAGIREERPGFGAVCLDFTGDGWVDIFVANDMQPNQLWVNQRNGTFIDRALELGCAVCGAGKPQAGMGVAAGDVDGDGRIDLLVTNLADQSNTLYAATGAPDGGFADRSASSGIGAPSLPYTSWGCAWLDLDIDGDLDLAVANGRIARGPLRAGAALSPFWNPYAEPNQLLLNRNDGKFLDAARAGGDFTTRPEATRALAAADIDRDGRPDIATAAIGNRLRVYLSRGPTSGRHWVALRAQSRSPRGAWTDALGAVVSLESGGRRQVRPILSTSSFQSATEPMAHFGLGEAGRIDRVEVAWPDGTRESFTPPAADRTAVVRKGEGSAAGR